jgi:hypothetical protein
MYIYTHICVYTFVTYATRIRMNACFTRLCGGIWNECSKFRIFFCSVMLTWLQFQPKTCMACPISHAGTSRSLFAMLMQILLFLHSCTHENSTWERHTLMCGYDALGHGKDTGTYVGTFVFLNPYANHAQKCVSNTVCSQCAHGQYADSTFNCNLCPHGTYKNTTDTTF